MATVTRADLTDAVHREIGLPRRDAAALVDTVIEAIAERIEAGEDVKLSSFGRFTVRDKGLRVGRNPKTGEPATILPRRVGSCPTRWCSWSAGWSSALSGRVWFRDQP